jgi:hypothetical protein
MICIKRVVQKYIGNSRRGQIYASVRDNLSADVRLEAIDDIKFYLLGFAYRAFNLVMPFGTLEDSFSARSDHLI